MKRLFLASAAIVAATGLAFAVGTAAPGGPPAARDHPMSGMHEMGGHHGEMMGALVARYDANGDGSITRAEIDSGITKDFRGADTDHNNKLTSTELTAYMQARHAEMMDRWHGGERQGSSPKGADDDHEHHGMGAGHMDLIKHLDWNLDGSLSLDEFVAPIRLLAMRLDRDGSGTITATDLLGHQGEPPREQ